MQDQDAAKKKTSFFGRSEPELKQHPGHILFSTIHIRNGGHDYLNNARAGEDGHRIARGVDAYKLSARIPAAS